MGILLLEPLWIPNSAGAETQGIQGPPTPDWSWAQSGLKGFLRPAEAVHDLPWPLQPSG